LRAKETVALFLLLALAALLRAQPLVGWGFVGDDPYYSYTSNYVLENGLGALKLTFGSNHRLGLWLPISLAFRCFGIHDASFVLFALLGSLLLVGVVYFLARRLFGPSAAFFAAGAQAVSSFDLAFASTMTIDIPTSCLLASSLLLFLEAERAGRGRNLVLHGLAAFCVLWAYFIKLPAPAILLVHGAYTLLNPRKFWRHAGFYGWVGLLLLASFAVDLYRTGDALHYLHSELASSPRPALFSELGWLYPHWMFLPEHNRGMRLFGAHFFLAALAATACVAIPRLRRASTLPLLWLAGQFAFLEFFPGTWTLPYQVMPRFFRYTHAFVAPASLLIGPCLAELWGMLARNSHRAGLERRWRRGLARLGAAALALALVAYAFGSITQGFRIARLYKDHYQDERFAARLLAALPPRPIYSDHHLYDRFNFETGYRRMGQLRWQVEGLDIQREIVGKSYLEPLRGVTEGYVVIGGSRGVDWGTMWILKQGDFRLPHHWVLIAQYDQPLDVFRPEVLRVYSVGPPPAGVARAVVDAAE
jgi:hypothetical protein